MTSAMEAALHEELIDRRTRLQDALSESGDTRDLLQLLGEVDAALGRVAAEKYGQCEMCHTPVEDDFLEDNPLVQYCLCDLSEAQQRFLERDLAQASRLQWALLPKQNLAHAGWRTHFRYQPAGPVSGDYCDLVVADGAGSPLYFGVGDVAGKGVAASFLMARLNAHFRTLVEAGLCSADMAGRLNRLFLERKLAAQYATLVCGRAEASGEVDLCNAGHCPPLWLKSGGAVEIESTGRPVGMFGEDNYEARALALAPGESLVLYSDGVSEARNPRDEEFGVPRLAELLHRTRDLPPGAMAAACLREVAAFRNGAPQGDDLTLLVLRREN